MSIGRLRAVFGININSMPAVQTRGQAMYDGLLADPVTYANPTIPLSTFLNLLQGFGTAQQAVKTRVIGAREKRDVAHDQLLTCMEVERTFVQALSDANRSRSAAIITGAGLVVALSPMRNKALLTLRNGKQSGVVTCDANVGMLVGAGAKHPSASRYFGWQYTLDGGHTFTSLVPTSTHLATITGLTPLTTVGVRVNLANAEGPGEWSQIVNILVK